MKKITIFYQPLCPFCKRAFKYINECIQENPELGDIEIEKIDELIQPDYADKFDYYYVPTIYFEGKKLHEGGIFKDEMKDLLTSVLTGKEYKQPTK